VQLTLVEESDVERAAGILRRHGTGEVSVQGRDLTVQVQEATSALAAVLGEVSAEGITVHEAGVRRPTLDDVFLTLTGHRAEADDEEMSA